MWNRKSSLKFPYPPPHPSPLRHKCNFSSFVYLSHLVHCSFFLNYPSWYSMPKKEPLDKCNMLFGITSSSEMEYISPARSYQGNLSILIPRPDQPGPAYSAGRSDLTSGQWESGCDEGLMILDHQSQPRTWRLDMRLATIEGSAGTSIEAKMGLLSPANGRRGNMFAVMSAWKYHRERGGDRFYDSLLKGAAWGSCDVYIYFSRY